MPFGQQLLVDLGTKAVNQDNVDPHAVDQGQVLHNAGQFAGVDGLTGHRHHKGLAPVHVDVRGHGAKPRHKGEVKDRGHGGGWFLGFD